MQQRLYCCLTDCHKRSRRLRSRSNRHVLGNDVPAEMLQETRLISAEHPDLETIVECKQITMGDHARFHVAKKSFAGFSKRQFFDVICAEIMQILCTIFTGDDQS